MQAITQRVQDVNPTDIPMTSTDYYMWLKSGFKTDVHAHDTKKEYLLERFGFIVGFNYISVECIQTLKAIESYYFDKELAPTLGRDFKGAQV